jgi:glycosyltransferase involved in cell wall biosynthesis
MNEPLVMVEAGNAADAGRRQEQETYRILLLYSELNRYGVAKSMLGLAQGLQARGHQVCCAADAVPGVAEEWESCGLRFMPLPFISSRSSTIAALSAILPLARIIRQERIQIVHSHHRRTSFLVSLLRPWIKAPLVTTCHGVLQGRRGMSLWGDTVICVSEPTRQRMVDYFGVRPEKTVLIHNGIDVAAWRNLRSDTSRPPHNSGDSPCITNISRLAQEKDQGSLLRAMALTLVKYPGARLRLVGSGPLEAELKALARELGIAVSVDFVGEVSDVKPLLAQTDVFVLSSTTEGLPISLLEAMAAGVPVVVTNVGGMPALVRHGQTGRLTEPQDFRRLADEIGFVLSHPEQVREMCRKGQELIEREFSLSQMAVRAEAVYSELMSKRLAR